MKMKWVFIVLVTCTCVYACDNPNINNSVEDSLPEIESISKTNYNSDLENFNSYLGTSKADVLDQIVESFSTFLSVNYDTLSTSIQRMTAFTGYLCHSGGQFNENWNFNTEKNRKILELYESSQLRNELWYYGYEHGEPLDSNYHFNHTGLFSQALLKFGQPDSIIQVGAKSRMSGAAIDYTTLICGAKEYSFLADNPFYLRILAADFYTGIMWQDVNE
jgi:hypothetical protein